MELSSGAEILMAVAAAEAKNIKSIQLEPEHIFLGLLKIEDLAQREALAKSIPPAQAQLAAEEIGVLVKSWADRKISAKQLRRRLRQLVAESQKMTGEFSGKHSPRGQELLGKAQELVEKRGAVAIGLGDLLAAVLTFDCPPLAALFKEFNLEPGNFLPPVQVPAGGEESPRPTADETPGQHPLAKYGRDLTALARAGQLGPVIGRDEEIKTAARILQLRSKNNPLILGEPGVGKTAIVEGLAIYAAGPNALESLKNLHIVEVTFTALVAGTTYRGQFEERLQEVLSIAVKDPDLVLFIDEIHTMVGAGGGQGALDAANIMKPALARGDINLIGATTTAEFRKHIEPDGALARRFQIVWVDEPDPNETLSILKGLRPKMEAHHKLSIPDEVLAETARLSQRFITDGHQPDKAISVLDQACAHRKLYTLGVLPAGIQTGVLEMEDVGQVIAQRSQIPLEVILTKDEQRLLQMEQELSRRVLGQEEAVRVVSDAVRLSRAGLRRPGQPIVLLFAGPTGTGKSELAKALSAFLFFDETRLITLDMTEYQEAHTVAKLIGSPAGYVGYEDEPQLIRALRNRPYSVVLLDEIEKAHPNVLMTFLQVFDEGRLTDARGRRIHCGDALFILTSNLGVTGAPEREPLGFLRDQEERDEQQVVDLRARIEQAVLEELRPELINRINRIVVFRPLSRETVFNILEIYVRGVNKNLEARRITVALDESARLFLMEQGYSPAFGARHLHRTFERWVTEPLSREILGGRLSAGDRASFTRVDDRLEIRIGGQSGVATVPDGTGGKK